MSITIQKPIKNGNIVIYDILKVAEYSAVEYIQDERFLVWKSTAKTIEIIQIGQGSRKK